jgi:hypothetical protein
MNVNRFPPVLSTLAQQTNALLSDFYKVAELSGINLPQNALTPCFLPAPHLPPSALPPGKMAVYVFLWKGQCLKVGKVGPKSQARYTSQHYNPKSARSNLSKSILSFCADLNLESLTEENVGGWIKSDVDRINILLDASLGIGVLSLLESYLQCQLQPRFEGFESQK